MGRRWLAGTGSEVGPLYEFSDAGRPAGQGGILSAAFPTDVSKGQAAYANDFNFFFFLRNIITEHKLGFNSRLISRGAAVFAGMAALEEAQPPKKLRILSPSKLPC